MVQNRIGNLLDAKENIIAHQVNHQGVMGAGLAKQIKNKYPEILKEYKDVCKSYSWEDIKYNGIIHLYLIDRNKYICNVFGQQYYGNGLQTDYLSFENGMKSLFKHAKGFGWSVAIPYKIGCGLAGGSWERILEIIEKESFEVDCTIYKLEV